MLKAEVTGRGGTFWSGSQLHAEYVCVYKATMSCKYLLHPPRENQELVPTPQLVVCKHWVHSFSKDSSRTRQDAQQIFSPNIRVLRMQRSSHMYYKSRNTADVKKDVTPFLFHWSFDKICQRQQWKISCHSQLHLLAGETSIATSGSFPSNANSNFMGIMSVRIAAEQERVNIPLPSHLIWSR